MAIGALRAARELGLRVPEDLSVIGIDDHEMASYFDLTTVAQPVHEQGRVAATQVLAALDRRRLEPRAGHPADPSWSSSDHRSAARRRPGR